LSSLVAGETLRILLVSARESIRDEVGQALTGRAGDYRLYWVSQSDLAPVRATDVIPHVVLVDDELGGPDPVTIIGQLATRLPRTAILALVVADAMTTARQAVLTGARGFVIKPIDPDELLTALRQVLASQRSATDTSWEQGTETGRIIVFCAPKGGTGRTTLAINTSVALQRLSKQPVVLIDADYSAPALDVALNLDSGRNITDLLPKLNRLDGELIAGVLATHASGIKVLLAPPPADLSSPISLPQVQQVLAWLRRMFPWVVVDLGLPMDDTAFAFLDGADRIIMSVLPEMVGLRNTRLMMDQLHERGYPDEKVWMVLNRATLRGGVSVSDIEERLRVKIKYQIPDDQPLATHSINRGVPLVMSHGGSAVARAVQGLVKGLLQDMPAGEVSPEAEDRAGSGLLSRFRRGNVTA
jgi:pilus assembly protein CpaE